MNSSITYSLTKMAKRLESDPDYMAFVLKEYQLSEHLSDDDFLAYLGLTEHQFARLALCKRPHETESFVSSIHQVAHYINMDPSTLAYVIRNVDVVREFRKLHLISEPKTSQEIRSGSVAPGGLFAAAREREQTDTEKEE